MIKLRIRMKLYNEDKYQQKFYRNVNNGKINNQDYSCIVIRKIKENKYGRHKKVKFISIASNFHCQRI